MTWSTEPNALDAHVVNWKHYLCVGFGTFDIPFLFYHITIFFCFNNNSSSSSGQGGRGAFLNNGPVLHQMIKIEKAYLSEMTCKLFVIADAIL